MEDVSVSFVETCHQAILVHFLTVVIRFLGLMFSEADSLNFAVRVLHIVSLVLLSNYQEEF
jgi:hypothetical protein